MSDGADRADSLRMDPEGHVPMKESSGGGSPPGRTSASEVLAGGGDTGSLMRAVDWSKTPLGPVESWPQSLRSAISICLGSGFPINLYWGPEYVMLYNDGYAPIAGGKHPWALGRGGREVWPEIWDSIGESFARVLATGEATYLEDSLLLMHRHGYT